MKLPIVISQILIILLIFSCVESNSKSNDATEPGLPATGVTKEWAFLVLLNGDNSLASYTTYDLNEMLQVGANSNLHLLVLLDLPGTASKIYYVNQNSKVLVHNYGNNIDTGDYHSLVDFFSYVQSNYPANHYFVTIWNHGGGWIKNNGAPKGISYDETSGNNISTSELGVAMASMKALNGGQKIDVLGMDACLMGMSEIIHQVNESVSYVVASEQTEPANGWDYDSLLATFAANPTMNGEEFASAAVDSYIASYAGYAGSEGVTLSAIDVNSFEQMLVSFNNFVTRANSIYASYTTEFAAARTATQSYYEASYKDLKHFVQQVLTRIGDGGLQTFGNDLITAIDDTIINHGAVGISNSNGLSIWLPTSGSFNTYKTYYAGLAWSSDTVWYDFLDLLN